MPMQPPAAINASDRRDSNGHHHTFNDDDDWDAGNSDLYEHSTPVRVRALYDYLPVEPDEIALTKGWAFNRPDVELLPCGRLHVELFKGGISSAGQWSLICRGYFREAR